MVSNIERNQKVRIAFVIIIGLHGLIHLLGFAKAFGLAEIRELTQLVSKPMGALWLLSAVLFLATGLVYTTGSSHWWLLGIAATLISQVLIAYFWKDAKFGTLPNVLILLVSVIAYADFSIAKTVRTEVDHVLTQMDHSTSEVITERTIADLPMPVQKWLRHSGMIGKQDIHSVRLTQKALMKMKPDQKEWSHAEAEQYFTTHPPASIWTVRLQMMPFVEVVGRDKFQEGKGEMLIKILSLLPIVNSKNNDKTNMGTLQRYLGEIVWFPSAATSPYIVWEGIDDLSAKATMTYEGTTGSGTFYFDENGSFKKFSALRYMGGDDDAQLKEWIIEVSESGIRNGVRIPTKMTATWKLDKGDWTWLQLELTEISYNVQKPASEFR